MNDVPPVSIATVCAARSSSKLTPAVPWMNSPPSSTGTGRPASSRVYKRPPIRVACFEHDRRGAGARKDARGGEPRRTGTENDRVAAQLRQAGVCPVRPSTAVQYLQRRASCGISLRHSGQVFCASTGGAGSNRSAAMRTGTTMM